MAQTDDKEQPDSGETDAAGESGAGEGQLDVQSIANYAMEMVQDQAKSHPFRTIGVAMGVGYVLGGGVPKFLVRLGMLAAGRLMADAITTEGLRSLTGNLTEDEDEAEKPPQGQSRAKNGHHRKRATGGERPARRA